LKHKIIEATDKAKKYNACNRQLQLKLERVFVINTNSIAEIKQLIVNFMQFVDESTKLFSFDEREHEAWKACNKANYDVHEVTCNE
jgi:hypothetical protein